MWSINCDSSLASCLFEFPLAKRVSWSKRLLWACFTFRTWSSKMEKRDKTLKRVGMDYPWWPRAKELIWSPYELVYSHNAVLPWEVQTGSRHVTLQNDLSAEVYKNLMIDDLEDLSCHRLHALENIKANKLRVAKYYNKKVKSKQFSEGDLVWKVKLLIRSKDSKFGKWSPN